jgi:hypothetical protein
MHARMTSSSVVDSFWTRVDKSSSDTGCWLWTGRLNEGGYGLAFNGQQEHTTALAHRMAWDLTHPAEVCTGAIVCHRCDNPRCVNPDHLFLGSRRTNNRDATVKGRARIITPDVSTAPIIDDSNIVEPADDIARILAEELPQQDIYQRRTATEKAFRERDALVVVLSKLWPAHLMRSSDNDPSYGPDWQWVVCIHSPGGQVSWRINDSALSFYAHLERLHENHWDGHNTKEKYARLAAIKPRKTRQKRAK